MAAPTRQEHEGLDERVRHLERQDAATAERWTHLEASIARLERLVSRLGWALVAAAIAELAGHGAGKVPELARDLLALAGGG